MDFCNQHDVKYFLIKETSQVMNYSNFTKKPLSSNKILLINILRNPLDNYSALYDGLDSYYSKNGEDFLTLTASYILEYNLM